MKNPIVQLIALVVLMVAAGTTYNFVNARNPQRHLKWVNTPLYEHDWNKIDRSEQQTSPPVDAGQAGGKAPPPGVTSPAKTPDPVAAPTDFTMITIDEAYEQLLSGAPFIDARRMREYEVGHIPTAISASPWEDDLSAKIAALIEAGAVTEAPVVVYCGNSKECEDSKLVCRQLKAANFNNLLVYQGGFPEWSREKKDLISTGKEPGTFTPPAQKP